jgi:hypothetical protein
MEKQASYSSEQLAAYVREHGTQAMVLGDGRLSVLNVWTKLEEDGTITAGQDWETLPASMRAVRDWLGY